jgi:uncharacterized protein
MRCYNCGTENVPLTSFCVGCGTQLRGEKIDEKDSNRKYFVQSIVLFACIVTSIVLPYRIVSDIAAIDSFLSYEFFFSGLLLVITIVFFFLDMKGFLKLFRFSFHLKPFLMIIFGTPFFALGVIYLAKFLSSSFGIESYDYFEVYERHTSHMYFYGILFVAILPGFIEEFLFRGILFNQLLRLTSPKVTIFVSALLFSFIHFSFIGMIWLLLLGLVLGYLRFRYRSIWYCILFHLTYNASVFLIEIVLKQF